MKNAHIKIWTRSTVPKEFSNLLDIFDDDDGEGNTIENTSFIAHVPQALVEDNIIQSLCNGINTQELDLAKILGQGFFGANGIDIVDHPNGDGHFLVGGDV